MENNSGCNNIDHWLRQTIAYNPVIVNVQRL